MASMRSGSAELIPFVPRITVEWLQDNPELRSLEVDGTISFVDISGFTAMSERLSNIGRAGAEEVTDVMNATFSALLDVAAKVARRSPPPSKSTVSPFGQCRRSRIDYRGGRC